MEQSFHPWKLCRYHGCGDCCNCGEECDCAWKFKGPWSYKPIESPEDETYVKYEIYWDNDFAGTFQVQWDGCSNLWDNNYFAFHFCGVEMIDEFASLLKELYKYTEDLTGRENIIQPYYSK